MPRPAWVAPVRSRTSGAMKKSATLHFFSGTLSNRSRPPDHLSKGLHRTTTSPARRKGVKNMRICGWRGPRGLAEAEVRRPVRSRTSGASKKKCHHPLFILDHFLSDRGSQTTSVRACTGHGRPRRGVSVCKTCGSVVGGDTEALPRPAWVAPVRSPTSGAAKKKCHHPLFFWTTFKPIAAPRPPQ